MAREHLSRETQLVMVRGELKKLRRWLAELQSYPASDAVEHAVKVLDLSTRQQEGNR